TFASPYRFPLGGEGSLRWSLSFDEVPNLLLDSSRCDLLCQPCPFSNFHVVHRLTCLLGVDVIVIVTRSSAFEGGRFAVTGVTNWFICHGPSHFSVQRKPFEDNLID